MKILVCVGTRPEAIKLAPVILELRKRGIDTVVYTTGQHEIVRTVLAQFGIQPDIQEHIKRRGTGLNELSGKILYHAGKVIRDTVCTAVIIQGDTTSAYAAALAAFYEYVPALHIEAGLRTYDDTPYPEEANRRMITALAAVHYAPTMGAMKLLIKERVKKDRIACVGNTVIDALKMKLNPGHRFTDEKISCLDSSKPTILLTCHRRETQGEPMRQIFEAVKDIAKTTQIIFPVHPNPVIKGLAYELLDGIGNVILTDAMEYPDFVNLMDRCSAILSDSGGIQEEAAYMGIPMLLLRANTERPLYNIYNTSIVGTEKDNIIYTVNRLREQGFKRYDPCYEYGEGYAAQLIVDDIQRRYQCH